MRFPVASLVLLACLGTEASAADAAAHPALDYYRLFGGEATDVATAVAADSAGNVYVAGYTDSSQFPTTNGFQTKLGGTRLRSSTDGGQTWSAPYLAPAALCVTGTPAQPAILYAGTALGVYRSADSGKTWSWLAASPAAAVWSVVVDAGNPAIVYAASAQGIAKSLDSGQTWSAANQGIPAPSDSWAKLAAHPARPSRLFAKVGSLYRSVDSGATWTPLANAPTGIGGMAFDVANPDVLYVIVPYTAVYKTTDAGDTWAKVLNAPVSEYPAAIAIGADAVYVATDKGVMISRDGGATWSTRNLTKGCLLVAIDPADLRTVYAYAGRMYVSSDGMRWSPLTPPAQSQSLETMTVAPTTPSTVFLGYSSAYNAFVAKFSSDGKQILYSTYLGGSVWEFPYGIAVDAAGNAYVAGVTYSPDFPVTAGALGRSFAGKYSGFVAKLSADGGSLVYSTLLGGSAGDSATAIALDAAGHAYVTGFAGSADFPVTAGAMQPAIRQGCPQLAASGSTAGLGDAFVAKILPDGSGLVYSTFLGGTCGDEGFGIAVDGSGSAYVVGATNSPDFPVTPAAFQQAYGKNTYNLGFLTKLDSLGAMVYSTYVGSYADVLQAVTVDAQGNAYVAGSSRGLEANSQYGACGIGYALTGSTLGLGAGGPALVLKLTADGSAKVWDAYLGVCEMATAIALDAAGNVWLTAGMTPAPVSGVFLDALGTIGPPPAMYPFQWSGYNFMAELAPDGSTLFASPTDYSNGMAVDAAAHVYVAGSTSTPASPPQGTAFLMRIDAAGAPGPSIANVAEFRLGSDYTPPPIFVPGPQFAEGSIMVLTGSGLGPAQQAGEQLTADGLVATSLGGASVWFDGIAAPLLSAQAGRVVCIVPFHQGVGNVQVEYNGVYSNMIHVPLAPIAVELLSTSAVSGSAGSVVTLFLAGMGPMNPPQADGQVNAGPSATFATPIAVNFFGQYPTSGTANAQIAYAGDAPGQVAGIAQVNFVVPSLPPGRYLVQVETAAGYYAYDQGFIFTITL